VKEPELVRPFKVPGGWPVLILILVLPLSIMVAAFIYAIPDAAHEQHLNLSVVSILALATGPLAFWGLSGLRKVFGDRRPSTSNS
jgi:hypothetical protein